MKKSAERPPSKLGLVYSTNESSWLSCQTITKNLKAAYLATFKHITHFPTSTEPDEIWTLAEKIFENNPDRLAFIDHLPHPNKLLHALAQIYGEKPLPICIFHVFGDFTLHAREWLDCESVLKGTKVKFICASSRQSDLVRSFILGNSNFIDQCHFPVDVKSFGFKQKIRDQWRKKLALKPDDIAITYTGRISLQKNVPRLLREIYEFSKTRKKPPHFFIAGSFDFVTAPMFGIYYQKGFYFHYWMRILDKFPEALKKNVHYLGNLNSRDIIGLCNATDIFASLSLHHDEDYGMSPAEALCCGARTLLTDWGGYSSFGAISPRDCHLVPVRIGERKLEISSVAIQNSFQEFKFKEPQRNRKKRASVFSSKLSVEKAGLLLSRAHQETHQFLGFSNLMKKYAKRFSKGTLYSGGQKKGSFYEEIYGKYIQP